ncbi:hypothetical protein MTY59_48570 [Mycobacterium senriense]|uniref:Uncharacterized protein n=1 Tax=Mycobacterium senriense TaxID=2775496 RepID=A0ABM7SUF9_9MYCO|nr:hypothetical protein MTY59_48570 [Mycobacterium senriense]
MAEQPVVAYQQQDEQAAAANGEERRGVGVDPPETGRGCGHEDQILREPPRVRAAVSAAAWDGAALALSRLQLWPAEAISWPGD